jgi:hypothetical protein
MHTGMLWFDNSNATLEDKIKKAVEYYAKKYAKTPDLCLVNPVTMKNDMRIEATFMVGDVKVRPYRPVLPGHIWVGIEDKG